jgi:hypothetical protein
MSLDARSKIAMVNLRRFSVYILIILTLFVIPIELGQAATASLTVKSGEEVTWPINLVLEDRVLIQFKAIGGTNTLRFSVSFPNATVRDFGESGDYSYNFICDLEGEYVLHFLNNDQTGEKFVTLSYEVRHYIFGIPQMLFMVFIIVVICAGGVAAFVMLGRPCS